MDRPSATEKSYLEGWRKVQGADGLSEEESCLA
jgi:hypothetical protein